MTQPADAPARQLFHTAATYVPNPERTLARVPQAQYFDHRALLLADRADFVLLQSPVEASYLEYLAGLGLGPDPAHVFDFNEDVSGKPSRPGRGGSSDLQNLAVAMGADGAAAWSLVPYLHHHDIGHLASLLAGQPSLSVAYPQSAIDPARRYSSRVECRDLARRLELPLPQGIHLEMERAMIAQTVPQHFSPAQALVIKGLWGSNGAEVRKLAAGWNEKNLMDKLSEIDPHGAVIIEEAIEDHLATNVMLDIGAARDDIEVTGLTAQLIELDTVHAGNAFPSRSRFQKEITGASLKVGKALQEEGFRGYAGVDFMETLPGNGIAPRYYFLEVNPRVNASLHPLLVMRKLNTLQRRREKPPTRAFVQLSYPVKPGALADPPDLLKAEAFDPDTGRGVVLYSPSFMKVGFLPAILLGQDRHDIRRLDEAVAGKVAPAGDMAMTPGAPGSKT